MKLYTTNFSHLKDLPDDILPIAISLSIPKGVNIIRFKFLAPSGDLLSDSKTGAIDFKEYTSRYFDELTERGITPDYIYDRLTKLVKGKCKDKAALVCWCGNPATCHRTLVANILNRVYNLNVVEYE